MTKGIIIAVTLLVACDEPRPINPRVDAPPHAAEAVEVVTAWMGERFGRPVDLDLDVLIWVEGPRLTIPDEDYGQTWNGVAYDVWPYGCEVWLVKKATITASAFVHELMHCFLAETTGDADRLHASDVWAHEVIFEGESVLWDWECPILYPNDVARLCKPLEHWRNYGE